MDKIMLKEGEDADIEVSWEDQSNINEFSKLNTKLDDLQDRIKERVRERDYLEDLEQELEMVLDEEELVSYRIADFFVQLPLDDAKSRIADSQSDISSQVSKLENEIGEINERMAKLKVLLYGRFGKAINLEKD